MKILECEINQQHKKNYYFYKRNEKLKKGMEFRVK
jgi:hypothetical protein